VTPLGVGTPATPDVGPDASSTPGASASASGASPAIPKKASLHGRKDLSVAIRDSALLPPTLDAVAASTFSTEADRFEVSGFRSVGVEWGAMGRLVAVSEAWDRGIHDPSLFTLPVLRLRIVPARAPPHMGGAGAALGPSTSPGGGGAGTGAGAGAGGGLRREALRRLGGEHRAPLLRDGDRADAEALYQSGGVLVLQAVTAVFRGRALFDTELPVEHSVAPCTWVAAKPAVALAD
jgi:hypothetical protein